MPPSASFQLIISCISYTLASNSLAVVGAGCHFGFLRALTSDSLKLCIENRNQLFMQREWKATHFELNACNLNFNTFCATCNSHCTWKTHFFSYVSFWFSVVFLFFQVLHIVRRTFSPNIMQQHFVPWILQMIRNVIGKVLANRAYTGCSFLLH